MNETSIQDSLREHAKGFDELLSFIPAKMYYGNGDDPSEQWKRKKQSKAEKKAAQRANLDPENERNKSVKEIMEQRAKNKRKLQDMQDAEEKDGEQADLATTDSPAAGLREAKKPKLSDSSDKATEKKAREKEKKKLLRKEKKLEKKQKKVEKQEKEKEPGAAGVTATEEDEGRTNGPGGPAPRPLADVDHVDKDRADEDDTSSADENGDTRVDGDTKDEMEAVDFSKLDPEEDVLDMPSPASSTPHSSPGSPTFDAVDGAKNGSSAESSSTTTSVASSAGAPSEKPKALKIPADTSALRARLAAKIEALRAARKADAYGKPIRTRQELIEARRQKQAERKTQKKEARRLAKLEEDRKLEEALASARNSPGSVLSPLVGGLGADGDGSANYFAFGRVAFADGTHMSHDLSYVKDAKQKKGPATSDHKAQLARLQGQKKRLAGMDDDKRKEVLEKETWLAARRRAEGDKVHDDEGLLKKAIKRKDKAKKKSEREWKERTEGVEKSMKDRQKKREDNLRKRRDDKKLGKAGKKAAAKARKPRAGFEGTTFAGNGGGGGGGGGGGRKKK